MNLIDYIRRVPQYIRAHPSPHSHYRPTSFNCPTAMPATTITQIVSFATNAEVNFEDLTSGVEGGNTGLRSQAIGTRAKEEVKDADLQVRHWMLGKCIPMWHPSVAERERTGWDAEAKFGALDLKKILPGETEVIRNSHVAFDVPPDACLSAPVTEMIFATTKAGQDLINFGGICDMTLRTTIEQPGCSGTAWGYTKEDPRVFVLLVGWDTISVRALRLCNAVCSQVLLSCSIIRGSQRLRRSGCPLSHSYRAWPSRR